MLPVDPASLDWVGSWDFFQENDRGYYTEHGGNLVEESRGHWIFLPNQALVQWEAEISYYVVDPNTGQSSLLSNEVAAPFLALWSTDYNQFRSYPYYNLVIATSLISGAGLNFDQETGQGFYDTGTPDINWQDGYYYQFNGLNEVKAMADPDDPYESPMVFTRTGGPESWNNEFYESELYFGLDLNQDGLIGNQSVDPIDPIDPVVLVPEPEPYDGIIRSVIGKGKLKGTKFADAFTFASFESFTKKSSDKIIGFDASQGDTIAVGSVAFPDLKGVSEIRFASTKSKKKLKKFSKEAYDFVYFEKKGHLYFDGNGSGKYWGDANEGGLVAILKGKPELTLEDFTLLA